MIKFEGFNNLGTPQIVKTPTNFLATSLCINYNYLLCLVLYHEQNHTGFQEIFC